MEGNKCPFAHPFCVKDCAIYLDGKCAVLVIAEKLVGKTVVGKPAIAANVPLKTKR